MIQSNTGRRFAASCFLAAVFPLFAHAGTVLHVDDDAPLGGDGTSWSSAFRFLQDALSAADNAVVLPIEIRIGAGTFLPDQHDAVPNGTKERNAHFALRNNLAVRGGYAGMDALAVNGDPNERDTSLYPTVLSGDLDQNDGPAFANSEENAFQVVVAVNVDDTAILDGVIIRGGRADRDQMGPTPDSHDQGAGINIYYAQPQIMNCTLEQNWNLNHGAINDHGGATITGCTFRDNYADTFGAGLYIHFDVATQVDSCQFFDNVTPNEGGGLYCKSTGLGMAANADTTGCGCGRQACATRRANLESNAETLKRTTITNCHFEGNMARLGAGLYNFADSSADITSCFFAFNIAVDRGAGIYCDIGSSPVVSLCEFIENSAFTGAGFFAKNARPILRDSVFERNEANQGEGGGGAWVESSNAEVINCTFLENSGFNGGGLYNGGTICPVVRDCAFVRNVALNDTGGGVSNVDCDPYIENCVFIGNIATTNTEVPFVIGGGMASYLCSPTVVSCDFRGNDALYGAGAMYNEGGEPLIINCRFESNTSRFGAAMYNLLTSPRLVNCLFLNNAASHDGDADSLGGAIMNSFDVHMTIENCTFTGNTSDAGGTLASYLSTVTINNSILWNNSQPQIEDPEFVTIVNDSILSGSWPIGSNIRDLDPQFVDAAGGDVSLLATSPAIDTGNPAFANQDAPTDLAGAARISNCLVDLGAFEFQAASTFAGDVNFDGVISVSDIGHFVNALLGTATPAAICRADVNGDGVTSVTDIGAFVALLQN